MISTYLYSEQIKRTWVFIANFSASKQNKTIFPPLNYDFENGDWVKDIIWDEGDAKNNKIAPILLNMNDKNLLVDIVKVPDQGFCIFLLIW